MTDRSRTDHARTDRAHADRAHAESDFAVAAPEPTRTVLRSDDLTCPSCVRSIETMLRAVDGVHGADVHFATGRIEIRHDPERASAGDLVAIVRQLGYDVAPAPF